MQRSGSYPTVNERTPVEIPFFGRCEGICPLISGWFQIHVNKPTQPIPGWRIETSAQTWRGGLFVYSCLEPAVHRAHPLPTLDIKGDFTGLPYGAAGKEPVQRSATRSPPVPHVVVDPTRFSCPMWTVRRRRSDALRLLTSLRSTSACM